MINIIEKSREFTKVEQYLLTQSQDAISLKDIEDGTSILVDGYIIYDITKNDETKTLLSLITDEKKVYTTISQTFMNEFANIWELFEGQPTSIIKKSGTTKNGRDFITCTLDVSAFK